MHKPKATGVDDKKLQQTLKKVGVQPITGIEEVNMFKRAPCPLVFLLHLSLPSLIFRPQPI